MSTEPGGSNISVASDRLVLEKLSSETLPEVLKLYETFSSVMLHDKFGLEDALNCLVGESTSVTIIVRCDGFTKGFIRLFNIEKVGDKIHSMECGTAFTRSFWGDPRILEACQMVIRDLFEQNGLFRLEARAFNFNSPCKSLLERLGFRKEGDLRGSLTVKGKPRTQTVYSILRPEYFNRK